MAIANNQTDPRRCLGQLATWISRSRSRAQFAVCVTIVTFVVACTSPTPASPKLLAECRQLYGLWTRYEQDPVFLHTGERAQAELALYDCQQGKYETGIAELQELLQHGGFHFPGAIARDDS